MLQVYFDRVCKEFVSMVETFCQPARPTSEQRSKGESEQGRMLLAAAFGEICQ
jgi:hypothetical protein